MGGFPSLIFHFPALRRRDIFDYFLRMVRYLNTMSVTKAIHLINLGREFDLKYQNKSYQISHTDTLKLIASKETQREYPSAEALFENFEIDGNKLADIWNKIEIVCIL